MYAANKEIASRFIEAFQAGDDSALESSMVEDTVDHNPLPGQRPGRRGVLDTLAMYRSAFPDLTLTIERQVAEGDHVVQNGLVVRQLRSKDQCNAYFWAPSGPADTAKTDVATIA